MASSTWVSSAMGERESLARDSVMRIMASSWRMVMGMEERAEAAISAEWTWRRMETKWEESFSPASGERRGAQRLGWWISDVVVMVQKNAWLTICSS